MMKNPIAVIGVDTHADGAVWVAVGRKIHSGSTEYCAFKNYPCFKADRLKRFMERAQRAQAALLARGEQ
jgi:hypothetical protein